MSKHRRIRRPKIGRRSGIAAITASALTLALAGVALADDVSVDNDVFSPGVQHSVDITKAPGASVSTSAQMVVDSQGQKHLTGGSSITVGLDTGSSSFGGVSGVTVGDAIGTVPAGWGDGSADFTLSSTISFNAPTTPGVYHLVIHYIATHYSCVSGDDKCLSAGTGDPFLINLTVQAPAVTNAAPSVAFTSPPTSADEGAATTFNFSVTDQDAGDSWSFAAGYPDCGSGAVSGATTVPSTAATGTFTCTFPDGVVPAAQDTVKVKVVDAANAPSAEASTAVTVNNVNPAVAQPAFASTSVDCRSAVTLGSLGFTDPGVSDLPWSVDIDWKDGSPHTTFTSNSQGALPAQTHTYNAPGTYTPTVIVTDKDGGANAATSSSNSVVVNQVYATDFLPPFDDSTPSGLIVNQMKNGRVVPVKATVYDICAQAYVTSPAAVTVGVKKVPTPTTAPAPDAIETYADAGASSGNTNAFRWTTDATAPGGGFWIYNLDSKALGLVTNAYYRLDVYVGGSQATKTNWGILQPLK